MLGICIDDNLNNFESGIYRCALNPVSGQNSARESIKMIEVFHEFYYIQTWNCRWEFNHKWHVQSL